MFMLYRDGYPFQYENFLSKRQLNRPEDIKIETNRREVWDGYWLWDEF